MLVVDSEPCFIVETSHFLLCVLSDFDSWSVGIVICCLWLCFWSNSISFAGWPSIHSWKAWCSFFISWSSFLHSIYASFCFWSQLLLQFCHGSISMKALIWGFFKKKPTKRYTPWRIRQESIIFTISELIYIYKPSMVFYRFMVYISLFLS